jgi:hypothetical protein
VTPYGHRTRNLPAPPAVVWDDLAEPTLAGPRVWLRLDRDEVAPVVLEAERPRRLVWASLWPSRPDDRVVLELAPGGGGTDLTFTLLAAGDPPDQSKTGWVRKRVNQLLWRDLRATYGQ